MINFRKRNESKEEHCSSYTDATSPRVFLNKSSLTGNDKISTIYLLI